MCRRIGRMACLGRPRPMLWWDTTMTRERIQAISWRSISRAALKCLNCPQATPPRCGSSSAPPSSALVQTRRWSPLALPIATMMGPLIWCSTMATARKSSPTRVARSRCRVANPPSREGVPSHETGPTGLPAVCLCPADYLGGDRRTADRATGLPCIPYVLRKGELPMQQRFSVEVPLLLNRVQVTHRCLCQAHEQLGASLLLFECEALIQPRHCKQAIKTVRTMGELASSLHAYLLTQDYSASLTVSLRLRLSLLKHSTEKVAMQPGLLPSCCRRHTASTRWLHQQAG